jgi:hypothetical protein
VIGHVRVDGAADVQKDCVRAAYAGLLPLTHADEQQEAEERDHEQERARLVEADSPEQTAAPLPGEEDVPFGRSSPCHLIAPIGSFERAA